MNKQYLFKVGTTILVISGMAFPAFADDDSSTTSTASSTSDQSTTKLKTGDVTPGNTVPGADAVDSMITNNNLRALSGSLSRWSIASQFNYNGGTVNEPLAQDRPDISGASGNTTKADLDGAISAKFNLNPTNSLMAGIGVRWIAPFSTGSLSNYNGTVFDMMNPYVQYQLIWKPLGIQSVLQVQDMQWTQADQTAIGAFNQISFDQESAYEIGKTHLSLGMSVAGQYNFFNKTSGTLSGGFVPDLTPYQSIYAFTFAPYIEYQITAKLNFRTLVNVWTYEHYANFQNPTDLTHDTIYESIGIGWSVTRDIFLYPNVQFLPANASADLTNVGIAATINVF